MRSHRSSPEPTSTGVGRPARRRPLAPAAVLLAALAPAPSPAHAQSPDADAVRRAAEALHLREIGPAVAGGRIADIAVHPSERSTWYVAVGSGGVWKTTNAGTTWTPVFDEQPSYSIGEVTLDPTNPDVVWVGTGENVSGRHVAWGDGVYRSPDAGRTWQRMGLERSEHIGRILVDPRDGDRVLVAAEGPLWSSGGERGVYRTTDGGETWEQVLAIDEDTGVTDLERHPTDPDVLYAAAYQRRRSVWSFLAGGPQSGIWKSADGGDTWREVETGLPGGDMGKIGLAVTPADPDLVYATIEASEGEQGFYRSRDRGESWERRNGYISGGTGPHYYQELEASPHDPDLVYQMDVFFNATRDGGATFAPVGTGREKHSDDHALWIDPDDAMHLLVGSDAGLYETFDEGITWRHFPNMPISQFYKVALSEREPYYDVLGGAQDLGTLHGPSRTTNIEGVRNQDWYVPLGADGYGVAFDPSDPDVFYQMTQNGNLVRHERRGEEGIPIQPQPGPGDPPERWNWDAPLLVSPHDSDRIWFGSQRLWRSDDRGDAWTAVSGDLTTGANRYELPMMGRVRSVDALYDQGAMSRYASLTAISESPVAEGVLWTGSDDGLVHTSPDGGASWTRAEIPGLPARAFVNDVEASQHDAGGAFVAADDHKSGDYRPYLFETTDGGSTWRSIAGDLPVGALVWAVQQDHVDPGLLFAATEKGIFFSPDHGTRWFELGGNVPTISFRDLKLQRRDDDLVGASFGRGFWVLDDYSPLRGIADGALTAEATLFPVRDAWWYIPWQPAQARGIPTQGSTAWRAPNPPHGATFTFHLSEIPTTALAERRDTERALAERGEDVPFPGVDALREEMRERGPLVLVVVSDAEGTPVARVEAAARAGLQRVTWDMRGPPPDPIDLDTGGFRPPWASDPQGPLMPPGTYAAELVLVDAEGARRLAGPESFELKPLPGAPARADLVSAAAFQQETAELMRRMGGVRTETARLRDRLRHMRRALVITPGADPGLMGRMDRLEVSLAELSERLDGDPVGRSLSEFVAPGIAGRLNVAAGAWSTTRPPTATQREHLEIARDGLGEIERELEALIEGELAALEADLEAAGAPWTPGRRLGGG